MAADVTREEFQVLDREVEGEKMVTRHILEQTRRNSDDLAAVKMRLDRVEVKVDGLDRKVDQLDRKVDQLDRKVDQLDRKVGQLDRKFDDLAKNLPGIVAEVVREVLREQGDKR